MERIYSRPIGSRTVPWRDSVQLPGLLGLPCGTLQGRGHTWTSPGPVCFVCVLETGCERSIVRAGETVALPSTGGIERIADQEDKTPRRPQIILRPQVTWWLFKVAVRAEVPQVPELCSKG